MSTILKALRRLEREKPPQQGKALRDDVVELRRDDPSEPHPDRALWWTGGAGAALALVLGSLWLASGVREIHPPGGGEAPTAIARPAPRPEAIPRPPSPLAEEPATRRVQTPPGMPETKPVPSAQKPSPPEPARRLEPSRHPARAPERPGRMAELPQRLPDPEPLLAIEAPTSAPAAPEVEDAAELEAVLVRPTAERKLPPAPEARVDSTTWHPDTARRLAVVSAPGAAPVTLHEGDAIGELVVLRIEPAAVVFLYQGREVHRRVGD